MKEYFKNFEEEEEKLSLEDLSKLKNRVAQMSPDEIFEFLSLIATRTFEKTGEGFNQEMIDDRTRDESDKNEAIIRTITKVVKELIEEKK